MIVGVIGVGVVGGTLVKWFQEHTKHELRLYDPAKGYLDFLEDCEAIFVSIPVPDSYTGQDQTELEKAVQHAKKYTKNVFIRSTVLPKTNDRLKTIAMPEFLTEKRAYQDMCEYPILCGQTDLEFIQRIFPQKEIIMMSNLECELAKFSHNCFGAFKVTYFNMIYNLCKELGADYEKVRKGFSITGFIEKQHTNIAPDGNFGYGGKCFPTNMRAMIGFLGQKFMKGELLFFRIVDQLNQKYRFNRFDDILDYTQYD